MKYQIYKAAPVEPLSWIADPCWYEDGMKAMIDAARVSERGFHVAIMLLTEAEHAAFGVENAQGKQGNYPGFPDSSNETAKEEKG